MLVGAIRDDRFDAASREPSSDTWEAVALVARHGVRSTSPSDVDGVHQRLEVLRLVRLARGNECAKRDALTVGQKMKLRAKASAGSSQGVVGWFSSIPFFEAPAAD